MHFYLFGNLLERRHLLEEEHGNLEDDSDKDLNLVIRYNEIK